LIRAAPALALLAVACAPGGAEPPAEERIVLLSVSHGDPFTGASFDTIAGTGSCPEPIAMEPHCVPGGLALAEAALGCAQSEVTIDLQRNHVEFVHFRAELPEAVRRLHPEPPVEATPLETVQCIRERIGFRFSAVLAPGRSALNDPQTHDARPFAGLHSPEAPRPGEEKAGPVTNRTGR
jgi:hypothetical protein